MIIKKNKIKKWEDAKKDIQPVEMAAVSAA